MEGAELDMILGKKFRDPTVAQNLELRESFNAVHGIKIDPLGWMAAEFCDTRVQIR
jgi:hypothetical protein